MPVKVFKDSFDNCYLVDIYEQKSAVIAGRVFCYCDFYPVFDLGDESYSFLRTFNKVYLDTFKDCVKRNKVEPDFSFFFRTDLGDQRFYKDELLCDKNSITTLKEASEFCRNYWLENYATNLPK